MIPIKPGPKLCLPMTQMGIESGEEVASSAVYDFTDFLDKSYSMIVLSIKESN